MAPLATRRVLQAGVMAWLCVAAGASALAQRLPADVLAMYGGTWSVNCANPYAPKLKVEADALMVERDGQRLTGIKPQAAASYFGNSPPENYEMALLSEVRGGSELLFIVYRDKRNRYIKLSADGKTAAALGSQLLKVQFFACKVDAVQPYVAAPSPPPAAGSVDVVVASPKFGAAWRKALGADAREPWLAQMNGPAPPPRWVNVAGARYAFNGFCKAHDCYDNSAVQLYAPDSGQIFGFVHRVNRDTLVGNPPPAVAAELQRLWKAEWRQQTR
ncbi:Ivy family c-type lysozyme inhibitor [Variovorax sp. J22R133]|uniref:Ivy family c-type lysozyme inhibitor n=1 Tax=Variovorax brevis TaxID=3053503 RepID=UPI00257690BD|nr:Ivy family c-type lysozyme inhibitor [Variovorax sp. J22R133]MDM0114663.1 Ivy family c-type lysozyme inhibitor [Variovorax sp. J22R133]